MSLTESFATDVSNDLPDKELRGIFDIIAIIMQVLEVMGPIIESCETLDDKKFGEGACLLAAEISERKPGWRFKRIRLRRSIKRDQDLSWREYRDVGGDSLIDSLCFNAVKAGPEKIEAMHAELESGCC